MKDAIAIVVDSKSVMDALNELLRRGQNMRPVMDAIGQRLEESVSGRFESKTDPSGYSWESLKPSTVKSYPKDGNRSLLDRTGDMLGSLNHHADADSVTVGFGVPYALFHEYGTKNMARRGLLLASPDSGKLGDFDEASIIDLVRGYFSGSI